MNWLTYKVVFGPKMISNNISTRWSTHMSWYFFTDSLHAQELVGYGVGDCWKTDFLWQGWTSVVATDMGPVEWLTTWTKHQT